MTATVNIGIAGWSYQDWKGIVYKDSRVDPLTYVSRYVDCVEINSTFYRPPSARYAALWLEKTSWKPEFYFTAKLHQRFTHEGKNDPALARSFREGFSPLLEARKLHHLLVQFRYDFHYTEANQAQLRRIVDQFAGTFDLVVEVRHRSWQSPEALDYLEGLGVTVCNLDYPASSDAFDGSCTLGQSGYFRLHGRNAEAWFRKSSRDETYNYYYNETELHQIKQRIDELAQAFKVLTVITNNHYRGAELANALELKALLTDSKLDIPEGLLETYPQLSKIALNKVTLW